MTSQYPKQRSKVTVVRRETGEVEEYTIDAGPRISPYLCDQSAQSGFLTLMDGTKTVNIPVDTIDRWEIELVEQDGWVPEPDDDEGA